MQVYQQKAGDYYTAIENAKKDYYFHKITTSTQTELFNLVDGLFTVKNKTILPSHSDKNDLAEKFLSSFQSKISDLLSDLSSSNTGDCHIYDRTNATTSQLSSFQTVSSEDVKNVIMSSRTKSCSLDPIPTSLLKKALHVLVPSITALVNSSLASGIFPSNFKHGLVTPVIKKKDLDPECLKNYRPITNLSFLSKTTERLVSNQLHHYLQVNGLYASMQSAYRPHHSTETALLRVHNDICLALDQNNDVILILLDLSSAFDMVNHHILLKRLKIRYGVCGTVLEWIKSYLSERTQSIKIGDVTSQQTKLGRGVPQGSVLGPSLFSLYVAPIEDIINSYGIKCAVYADDTQLYISIDKSHLQIAVASLQSCIEAILDWLADNELVCNELKTDVIQLYSRFQRHDTLSEITIGKSRIELASSVRDLGVIIDSELSMSSHVNQICKSASFSLRRVGLIRRYLDDATAEKLTHALITSKLDQCNSLLYELPDRDVSKFQRIQNSAARMVTRTKNHEHITPILKKLHWLPIKKRILYKILLLTFKSLNGLAPDYLRDLLVDYKPSRTLRSSSKHLLFVPKVRTKYYGGRAFSTCAPKYWNSLPTNIKQASSVEMFKKQLKTFLFELDLKDFY